MPPEQVETNRAGMRLQIELPRRDVHMLALLRRRLYDISCELRFATPDEVFFWLTIVDSLYGRVENARKTRGFTWNTPRSDEEDGVGTEFD